MCGRCLEGVLKVSVSERCLKGIWKMFGIKWRVKRSLYLFQRLVDISMVYQSCEKYVLKKEGI